MCSSPFIRLGLAVVFAAVLGQASLAQIGGSVPEDVVTWRASALPPSSSLEMTTRYVAGDRLFITLTAGILEGWRVYAIDSPAGRPLEIELDPLPEAVEQVGGPGQTEPRWGHDPGLDADYTYHEGRARVWQGLHVREEAAPGEYAVTGWVRYAACNDEMCLPVKTYPFRTSFIVTAP